MTNKILSTICSLSTLILLTGVFTATSAWSTPGDKKPSLQRSDDKDSKELGKRKNSDKGKKSVKKKAAKNIGTAAVVGVAATKVKSGTKKLVQEIAE